LWARSMRLQQPISAEVRIEGVGHVAWTFLDCRGMLRMLKLPAYYAPMAGVRLFSTLSLLQEYPNEFLNADRSGVHLLADKEPRTASKRPWTHRRTSRWPTPLIMMVPGVPEPLETPQTARTEAMVIQVAPVCTDPASMEVLRSPKCFTVICFTKASRYSHTLLHIQDHTPFTSNLEHLVLELTVS
jgi:hypothetical protein